MNKDRNNSMKLLFKNYLPNLVNTATRMPYKNPAKKEIPYEFVKNEINNMIDNETNMFKCGEITLIHYNWRPESLVNEEFVEHLEYIRAIINNVHIKKHVPVTIIYYPCKLKRRFPNPDEMMEPVHINGGLYDSVKIIVYREEAARKVIIHELIHASLIDAHPLQLKIHSKYKSALFINEAIVEVYATIFNILLRGKNESLFSEMLENEILWGKYNTARLVEFFNNSKWIEGTNAMAYIYVKTYILCNLDKFMLIEFPYTEDKLKPFFADFEQWDYSGGDSLGKDGFNISYYE